MQYRFTIGVGHTLKSKHNRSMAILPSLSYMDDVFYHGLDITWLGLHLFIGLRNIEAYVEDLKDQDNMIF